MDQTPLCIGTRTFWGSNDPKLVLLHPEDRAQHLYVVGKTGLGKSTLLRNLILQDLYAGRGVGLLDPHGDLAREVLDAIPRKRTGEVLYFNPGDLERPVGLNLLPRVPRDAQHVVVSGVLSAFRGIWGSSWGPRLEYILGHALAALLDYGGLTILALPRLLSDDAFRERVATKVRDPVVRAFWRDEYPGYERRFRLEAIAPIQNKVGRLLANAPLRNIVGQKRCRFDASFLMDRGRIMVADLAKGTIGEDPCAAFGGAPPLAVPVGGDAAGSAAGGIPHPLLPLHVTGEKHAGAIARFTELVNHIEPDAVVLEDVAAAGSRRRYRVRRLIESLAAYSRGRGIPVHTIARSAVAKRFAPEGEAATKHAIAAQLAKSFPEIAAHLPPRRKVWQSEDERMALFDALALAVTYASD